MKRLTKEQRRDIAALAAMDDADIDLTDMPEVLDWSGAEIGRFYRPKKRPVTMRLDGDVVDWLKSFGAGYQTKANMLLRHAMVSAKEGRPRRSLPTAARRRR
ncbi:MAG TPA: BrnA antitoxin family protein [Candidatus Sulfotelmatobacter sp.]|nr:BrnA antitoxin family protein [Candidatus Sulfotelmatobacter sp.]